MGIVFPGNVIGGFSATGVNSSGTQYARLAADLTGDSDTKTGTVSVWFQTTAAMNGTSAVILSNGADASTLRFMCIKQSTEKIRVIGYNVAGSTSIALDSTSTVNDHVWHHLLASWDTSTAASCKLYLDGSDDTNLVARADQIIDYTRNNWATHTRYDVAFQWKGDLAELWFDNTAIDITSAANRAKFSSGGKPVSLGGSGQRPTGSAPLLYMRGGAANWGTNYAGTGDFTVTGTFSDSSTKPSY